MHIHIPNGIRKLTLKQDRHGRLCIWAGSVQSQIIKDDHGEFSVPGQGSLARLEGHDRYHVISKLEARLVQLLENGYAMVLRREEVMI